MSGGPVAMAVEQRADDPAVEHAGERVMMRLGSPIADDDVALHYAFDAETLRVGRPAAKADAVGRMSILKALHALKASSNAYPAKSLTAVSDVQ